MKATINIPTCKNLHACNRWRVIAKKRGIAFDMKCDPITCTAYFGDDTAPASIKKALFSKVMELNPMVYWYIKDARLRESCKIHDEIYYYIEIDDERKYKGLASEMNIIVLREAAKQVGIEYLAVIHKDHTTVYDSNLE